MIFDPRSSAGTPMDALLQEINRYLDARGVSRLLAPVGSGSAVAPVATVVTSDVRFGCLPDNVAFDEDCAARGDSALGPGRQASERFIPTCDGRKPRRSLHRWASPRVRSLVSCTGVLPTTRARSIARMSLWKATRMEISGSAGDSIAALGMIVAQVRRRAQRS